MGIVAAKPANKGAQATAETVERRPMTNGNSQGQSTGRTQSRATVTQAAERIRQFVKREPQEKLTALLHHVTPEALRVAYYALKREAAPGVDGMTWREYETGLEVRLHDLHRRVHTGAYRATPVRRVNIDKPDGGTRPLGVAALEDKIVQKAVVDVILTPIYEEEFLGISYGFRPGRGAHDALDALAYAIERRKVNWILDADIRGYFDSISRDWLIRFLEHRIGDRRVLRLIKKWLRAGVLEEGRQIDAGRGTAQGSVISPMLANIYLHYVLDLWVTKKWRPQEARGDMIIVRYADDYVAGFEHTGRCGTLPAGTEGAIQRLRAGTERRQDPTPRVWTVCRKEPPSTWGRATGDVRLSGFHALLQEGQERTLRAGAEANSEADESYAEEDQDRAPQTHA